MGADLRSEPTSPPPHSNWPAPAQAAVALLDLERRLSTKIVYDIVNSKEGRDNKVNVNE